MTMNTEYTVSHTVYIDEEREREKKVASTPVDASEWVVEEKAK